MKVKVFWDMIPCSLIDLYQCSEKPNLVMEAAGSSETITHIYHIAFDNITENVYLHYVVCPDI
jgi:hypothetical protein